MRGGPSLCLGAPATSILPRPAERSGLGTEPTPSRSPRARRAVHVSPKSPPPGPKIRGILQASSGQEPRATGSDPRAASTLALDGPEPQEEPGYSPSSEPGCPSLTPSLRRGSQHPPSLSATAPVRGQTQRPPRTRIGQRLASARGPLLPPPARLSPASALLDRRGAPSCLRPLPVQEELLVKS